MEIRERRDHDLDDLVAIAARVHASDGYPMFLPDGDFVRFLVRPSPLAAWVAVREQQLVGHVVLNDTATEQVMQLVAGDQPARPAVYVARLFVDPGARRLGVGRQLLEHARGVASDMGRAAHLDVVDTPGAAPAICLYRCDGWEEIGRVRFDLLGGGEIDELVFRAPPR